MTKKKVAIVALILICLALIAGTTFAYFTYEATAHNVITTGKVDFSLHETGDGGIEGSDGAIRIMPGTTVNRSAVIKNSDIAEEAYIRAQVDIVIRDDTDAVMSLTEEEILENVLITYDDPDWTLIDGWWYYNKPLKPGEETASLFDEVSFSTDMDNKFQLCTVTVTITYHAVQVKNNGSNVFEAVGWPA